MCSYKPVLSKIDLDPCFPFEIFIKIWQTYEDDLRWQKEPPQPEAMERQAWSVASLCQPHSLCLLPLGKENWNWLRIFFLRFHPSPQYWRSGRRSRCSNCPIPQTQNSTSWNCCVGASLDTNNLPSSALSEGSAFPASPSSPPAVDELLFPVVGFPSFILSHSLLALGLAPLLSAWPFHAQVVSFDQGVSFGRSTEWPDCSMEKGLMGKQPLEGDIITHKCIPWGPQGARAIQASTCKPGGVKRMICVSTHTHTCALALLCSFSHTYACTQIPTYLS